MNHSYTAATGLNISIPRDDLRQYLQRRNAHHNERLTSLPPSDGLEDAFDDDEMVGDLFGQYADGVDAVGERSAPAPEASTTAAEKSKNSYETDYVLDNVSLVGDNVNEGHEEEAIAAELTDPPLKELSPIRPEPSLSQDLMPPPPPLPSRSVDSTPRTPALNPYETSNYTRGNISIAGDSVLSGDHNRSLVGSQSKAPMDPPPPPLIQTSFVLPATPIQTPQRSQLTQKSSKPPKNMRELYMAKFHRPFITTEGFNLDEVRRLPEPKDKAYLRSKKAILNHRDQIQEKFATMQSANNITSMLYFEEPLDPRCFIDQEVTLGEPEEEVTRNTTVTRERYEEQNSSFFSRQISKDPRIAAMPRQMPEESYANLWEQYETQSNGGHGQNKTTSFKLPSRFASTFSAIFEKYSTKPDHLRDIKNYMNNNNNLNDSRISMVNRETQREGYFKSMMYHYLRNGSAPPVEELDESQPEVKRRRRGGDKKMVTIDESRNEVLSFAEQLSRSIESQARKTREEETFPAKTSQLMGEFEFELPDSNQNFSLPEAPPLSTISPILPPGSNTRPLSIRSTNSNNSFYSAASDRPSSSHQSRQQQPTFDYYGHERSFLNYMDNEADDAVSAIRRLARTTKTRRSFTDTTEQPSINMDMSLYPYFKI